MSARQRAAYLLFDGHRPLDEVLSSTVGLGVTQADVLDLVEKEFLQIPVAQAGTSAVPATEKSSRQDAPAKPDTAAADPGLAAERYQRAYPLATSITAAMGLRGFRLNLAVEAAHGYDGLLALLPQIAKSAPPAEIKKLAQALGVPPP